MSSTTMVHLPQSDDPRPLEVSSDIQSSGTATLRLAVIGDFTVTLLTTEPQYLRQIATVAAELADRLEAAQVIASYVKPVSA